MAPASDNHSFLSEFHDYDFIDIDPDVNFWDNVNYSSNLIAPENLYGHVSHFDSDLTLSILHINTRSLIHKLSNVQTLIDQCNVEFSIIGLTETWLDDVSDRMVSIPGYKFNCVNRPNRIGGGVGCFVKNGIPFVCRNDLCRKNDIFDWMAIELVMTASKNSIIYVVYRPPNSNFEFFIDSLYASLISANLQNKHAYILGDFNINLLADDSRNIKSSFIDSLFNFSLFPLIKSPTRVTDYSATLIDNIFTNNITTIYAALLCSDISDHFPICAFLDHSSKKQSPSTSNKERNLNTRNLNQLNVFFLNYDWSSILQSNNVDEAFAIFVDILINALNHFCPLRSRKSVRFKRPWFTSGLLISSKRKNNLYLKYLKNRNLVNKQSYIKYKNLFTKLCRASENKYINDQFIKNQNNIKKTWNLIKTILPNSQSNFNISLRHNDELIHDREAVCNLFNQHFSSAQCSLSSQYIASSVYKHSMPSTINSIFFDEVSESEVVFIVKQLNNKHSSGHDEISNFLLKQTISSLITPFTHLINLSLSNGKFPSILKITKVKPIFKKGDVSDIQNYRPISLVSVFSKIIEKLVENKLISFLNKSQFFSHCQYGFRANSSTELAILDLCHYVAGNMNNKYLTLGVFLDLSRAFDSIDHKILLSKLDHYGVRGVALKWFEAYLLNRSQYVCIDGVSSPNLSINKGVPQGSILGPLLFNIYINDLVYCSPKLKFIMYADDSNILYHDRDVDSLVRVMNEELDKIADWLTKNKLHLNMDKTNFMLLGPKIITNKITISICIKNNQIKRVFSIKFLGVIINSELSWIDHILFIKNKISKNIGIIFKIKCKIPKHIIQILYFSLIYPYLIYCLSIWGGSPISHMKQLKIIQNNYLRILFNLNKWDHISSYYAISKIVTIENLYLFRIFVLSYKLIVKKISSYFLIIINSYLNCSSRLLRNINSFYLPICRTKLFNNTPIILIMKFWNSLPFDIKCSPCLFKFKKSIFNFISSIDS